VKETVVMCYYRYKGCGNWRRMARVTECETGKIMKVRYAVAVKKEGIIVGDLPQKISCVCRITFAILTSHNGLASLGFSLYSLKFLYFTVCDIKCVTK